MKQVCPWCQTEITWDEEIGPEDICPHCYNELSDYRTISIPAAAEDKISVFDEDPDTEWNRYVRAAEAFLAGQEEVPECPQCRESMVHAGEHIITGQQFIPRNRQDGEIFLSPPVRTDVYVCANCFTVIQQLSGEDRKALIRKLASGG